MVALCPAREVEMAAARPQRPAPTMMICNDLGEPGTDNGAVVFDDAMKCDD